MTSRLQPYPIPPLDRAGIIKDLSPEQIPDGGWSDGQNVRFIDGRVLSLFGYSRFVPAAIEAGASGRIMHGDQFTQLNGTTTPVLLTLDKAYSLSGSFVSIQDASVFTGNKDQFFFTDTAFNLFLIANGKDVARKWVGPGNNIATLGGLSTAAPLGGGVIPGILRRMPGFVFALNNLEDGSAVPYRCRWGVFGAAENWKNDVNGNGQAGFNDLDDTPTAILNGIQLNNSLAIYKRDGVYLASYVGPPTVFYFVKVVTGRGLYAARAVVSMGSIHFFLSDDGFYAFDGANIRPISDDKVRDFFYQDLNPSFANRVQAVLLKQFSEVWWAYPSVSSSGDFDKVLIYNYRKGTWSFMIPAVPLSSLFLSTLQSSVTWKTEPNIPWSSVPGIWNDATKAASIPVIVMGTAGSILFQHGIVYSQDGGNYTKQATSKAYDFKMPGMKKRLQMIQFSVDPLALKNLQIYVGTANSPSDTPTWNGPYKIQTGYGQARVLLDISSVYFFFKFQSTGQNDSWEVRGFTPWSMPVGQR